MKKDVEESQKIDHIGIPCNHYLALDYGKL